MFSTPNNRGDASFPGSTREVELDNIHDVEVKVEMQNDNIQEVGVEVQNNYQVKDVNLEEDEDVNLDTQNRGVDFENGVYGLDTEIGNENRTCLGESKV